MPTQDIQGIALLDYLRGNTGTELLVHASYGEIEKMPVADFFRSANELPPLEEYALQLCRGTTLDIGAGAGSHSLILQSQGIPVQAIDISPLSAEVMRERGVQRVVCADIFQFESEPVDTLLLMMNGIGLVGDLRGLNYFLLFCKKFLKSGGQILLDSCDVSYLGDTSPSGGYVGEIAYQFEYLGKKGTLFNWLYVDANVLKKAARKAGWRCQVVYEEDNGQYLARLTLR